MNRVPDTSRGSNPRLTPLMMQSFSRLLGSTGSSNSSSLNGTGDSGFLSSFTSSNSSTPSETDSSSQLYCSTPVASGLLLSHQTAILNQTSDQTPVSHYPGFKHRGSFSEDRIPRPSPSLSDEAISLDVEADDLLSRLIRTSAPAVRRILQYLSNEDLLRLCQACDTFCRAVFDQQPILKRLSKYLISVKQNAENRSTPSHNNLGARPFGAGDILRPVQNVFNLNATPGVVWTVPSPLENVDLKKIPQQLRALILLTKELSSHHCVALCHNCRCLVPIRLYQQHQAVECSSCHQLARKGATPSISSRALAIPKKKKALFPNFR